MMRSSTRSCGLRIFNRLMLLWVGLLSFTVTQPTKATELSEERWSDAAFGLSALLPLDNQVDYPQRAGAPLVIIKTPWELVISVDVKEVESYRTAEELREVAVFQFTTNVTNSVEIDVKPTTREVFDRKAGLAYFAIDNMGRPDVVAGQALFELDSPHLVIVRMQAPADRFDQARETFEAMLDSFEIESSVVINERRQRELLAGSKVLEAYSQAQTLEILPKEQWFRIVRDRQDLGYRRQTIEKAFELGSTGTHISLESLYRKETTRLDIKHERFVSDDQSTELWSVVSTHRLLDPTPVQVKASANVRSHSETGLRSNTRTPPTRNNPTGTTVNRIEVTYENTAGKMAGETWLTPEQAYLSQVDATLLPFALQNMPDAPSVFALYAYDAESQSLAYRRFEIAEHKHGLTITVMPSLRGTAERYHFGLDQSLTKIEIGENQTLIPTTLQDLKRRWKFFQ